MSTAVVGSYPSSGIPYPGPTPASYYSSGSQSELRKSRPTSGISISGADRRGSMYMAGNATTTTIMATGSDIRRDSTFPSSSMGSNAIDHCIEFNAVLPIHKLEEGFNRMKIREVFTSGSHFDDTTITGGKHGFSNYISHRMSRVLRDYHEMKQDEEKDWDWQAQEYFQNGGLSMDRRNTGNANNSWMMMESGKQQQGEQNYPRVDTSSSGPVQTEAQFCGDKASLALLNMAEQQQFSGAESQFGSMKSKRGRDGKLSGRQQQGYSNFIQRMEWFPRENAKEHHTDFFHNVNMEMIMGQSKMFYRMNNDPILRRGQTFFFAMRLAPNAVMNWSVNPMFVHFMMGSNPSMSKGTKAVLKMNGNREFMNKDRWDEQWDIRMHSQEGDVLTLQVRVPVCCPVGVWACQIQCGNNNEMHFDCHDDIYILFNPYNPEDTTFMDNNQHREEFLENDSGAIFQGTYDMPKPYEWVYGQFNDIVLPMVILLLDRFNEFNGANFSERANPAFMARSIASMMYSPYGVLRKGNSEGDDCKQMCYTGTYPLFEKLIQQQFMPVQCNEMFIPSALVVTFCRALGIPCRSVTVYQTPFEKTSLDLDMYWKHENQRENDIMETYHCWNDVWIRRDDLLRAATSTYAGWQAIDPHERGYGPAPCEAIRKGDIGINFDVFYFYSMMNSRIRHYYFDEQHAQRTMQDEVARTIVTRRMGFEDKSGGNQSAFEDITTLYKRNDGFDEQNMVVQKAFRGSMNTTHNRRSRTSRSFRDSSHGSQQFFRDGKEDMAFEWNIGSANIGQNIPVSLMIQNMSNESRMANITLFARPVFKNGFVGHKLKEIGRQMSLNANQKDSINFELIQRDYQDQLDSDYTIRFYGSVFIRETNQFWGGHDEISLEKPKIQIQTRSEPQKGSDFQVNFTMMNPLNVPLTDCFMFYEAPGVTKPVYRRFKNIKPGEMLNINETFMPRKCGETRFVAVFNSRQLKNVSASKMLCVRD